jgi:hypothetical protein
VTHLSASKREPPAVAVAQRLRRYNRVRNQLLKDRGGDPSQAQLLLAENISALAVWCQDQIATMVDGGELEISQYTTSANALRRLLETFGLDRVPKDVTTLEEHLAKRAKVIDA